MQKLKNFAIPLWCNLAIILAGYWFLISKNSDMLFMAQNQSFFSNDIAFAEDLKQVPGGWLNWLGCWFTQFFYKPEQGAAIIIGLWLVLFWTIKKAWRITNLMSVLILIPIIALLCSVIDLGYWVYYIKMPGYFFRETLGMIIVALVHLFITIGASTVKNNKNEHLIINATYIAALILASLLFSAIGWYSNLLVVSIIARAIADKTVFKTNKKKLVPKWYSEVIKVVALAAIFSAKIIANQYTAINTSYHLYANFPIFDSDNVRNWTLSYPIIIAAAFLVIAAFIPKIYMLFEKSHKAIYSVVSCTILFACGFALLEVDFDDYNYHAECRMYRAVDEQRWNDVLAEMSKLPGDATREMVLFKNIALFNTGKVGTDMFKYNNKGKVPFTRDSLSVHMVQTCAPLVYLHHGKTNFSYRWCIENTVEYGYRIDYLKILATASLINGEMEVARKYLDIISGSMYYKDWADHYRPIIDNPDKIHDYPEFKNIIELRDHMGTVLDGDNGLCEMYLLNYFSNTMNKDSKYLQEMTLVYSLVQKDIQLFWPRFFLYAQLNQDKEMPLLYQQAAYLYANLEPGTVDISKMPFDKENVLARYASFNQTSQQLLRNGMKPEQVGSAMYSTFGDTFWWFYFFCRDVHSY